MTNEIWRPVIDYEGFYEVSNTGRIRRVGGDELFGNLNSYGYKVVSLTVPGKKRKCCKVHRLVALAFLPTIAGKNEVNHKDGNKLNNHVDNLEWCDRSENIKHATTTLNIAREIKPVWQLSLDGDPMALYLSATTAAKVLNGSNMMIAACCKGTAQTAYNYRWQYADGVNVDGLVKECRRGLIQKQIAGLKAQIETLEAELNA